MKKICTLLILLASFFTQLAYAQRVDYSKIIDSASRDTAERLVVIAWRNNPDNKQFEHTSEAFRYDLNKTSAQWLNMIAAQGNVNEFTIHPTQTTISYYYPRYNFGITIPLGIFWTQPAETKAARNRWQTAIEKVNSQKMDIRNKVLDLYQDYYLNRELLRLQSGSIEDDYIDFLSKQKKFKRGEITMETYSTAERKYTGELVEKLTLQRNFNVSKYDLERLIGVKLEEAFRQMK